MNRRELLILAGSVSTALAGCGGYSDVIEGDTGTDPYRSGRTGWSTFKGDPARSGVRPASAGPGDSLSVAWELTTKEIIESVHDIDPDDMDLPPTTPYLSWPVLTDDLVVWTSGYGWSNPETESRDRTVRIIAANSQDGSIMWSDQPDISGVSTRWFAPEIDDGRLYLPYRNESGTGMVVYDPATGDEINRLDLGLSLSAQPLVTSGTIYLNYRTEDLQAHLSAFDADTGEEEWSISSPLFSNTLPGLTLSEDTLWYFDASDGREFVARDVTDGSERWRESVDDLPRSYLTRAPTLLAPPTVVDGTAYAAGTFRQLTQRDIAPLVSFNSGNGSERWRYTPPGAPKPMFGNMEPEQIEELPPYAAIYGYPVVGDERVIATGVGGFENDTPETLIAVNKADGTLDWSIDINSIALAPVAAGDIVYVVTNDRIEAISTAGEKRDSLARTGTRVTYPPALGHGQLYVPIRNGIVAVE